MTKVAIVILNFNGKHFLQQFLPSVVNYSEDSKIVVADNGSSDGSGDFVKREFPKIEVISLSVNKGFCGGYNEVLKQVQAKYYVLLNSDVEVTPDWLSPIIELMDRDQSIAAAQPKILAQRSKNKFEYAGAAGGKIDMLAYPFCRGRLFDSIEEDNGQYDDVSEIFWASGACMFVRANLYHEMGGLDEDFFAHMEEIDLCWKLSRAGYKIFYHGKSTVYHVGGGTLSASNPRKTYFNFRNGLSLLIKHQRYSSLMWKFPLRLLLDWAAAIHFLMSGSGIHAKAVIIAHLSFIRRFGREMKKRSATARQMSNFKTSNVYEGLIVFDYFLGQKKTFRDLKS
ncbi:MAG: glycosyltransferase family 2 protein [Bacteroidetes bacterium]|nr:glycosyltransferase family 2 protein [Bacteroidota bacterium]MBI3483245.1 glycosyltransferase family 2 protein [Bacteroidota bacterium]